MSHLCRIGAYDGISGSNTFLLERCCGWNGTLIEANPDNFAALQDRSNRSAVKVHQAICSGGPSHVNFTVGGGVFAGTPRTLYHKFASRATRQGFVPVPCDSLEQVLDRAGQPNDIDFLSLDVEGAEEQVLATVDPARFKLIMFEANLLSPAVRARINATLLQAGHTHVPHLEPWASMVYARVGPSAAAHLIPGSCRTTTLAFGGRSAAQRVPDCSATHQQRIRNKRSNMQNKRVDFTSRETSRAELWEALNATLLPKRTHSKM